MSLTIDDRTKAAVNAMKKRKDKTFISRMVKTLTKLQAKYLPPRHNSKRQLSMKKQKNSPIIPDELAPNYHNLAAQEPEGFTVSEPIPHVIIEPALPNQESCRVPSCSPDHGIQRKNYQENEGRGVIDMARTKRTEKTLPANHAWGSFNTDDESDGSETKTSFITRVPTENLVNFANMPMPNPNVSSDKASTKFTQSDPEESSTSISTSLPLSQDSLIYQNPVSSPSPPTRESSPTTDLLIDMSYEVAPFITAAPLLPTLSPRRPLVISCPAGAGDEQFIAINLSPVDDVSLEPDDDVIDQVTLGNNFPTVCRTVPSTEVVPVDQQDEEAVPVPPKPDTNQQDHPQRDLHCLDYRSLHEEGEDARSQSRQEGDWKEDTEEDTQEEMEDTEDRGAPDS